MIEVIDGKVIIYDGDNFDVLKEVIRRLDARGVFLVIEPFPLKFCAYDPVSGQKYILATPRLFRVRR